VLTKVLALPSVTSRSYPVVFVSKRTFLDQKWGTREPVVFRDRELGVGGCGRSGCTRTGSATRALVNTIVGSLGQFEPNALRSSTAT